MFNYTFIRYLEPGSDKFPTWAPDPTIRIIAYFYSTLFLRTSQHSWITSNVFGPALLTYEILTALAVIRLLLKRTINSEFDFVKLWKPIGGLQKFMLKNIFLTEQFSFAVRAIVVLGLINHLKAL